MRNGSKFNLNQLLLKHRTYLVEINPMNSLMLELKTLFIMMPTTWNRYVILVYQKAQLIILLKCSALILAGKDSCIQGNRILWLGWHQVLVDCQPHYLLVLRFFTWYFLVIMLSFIWQESSTNKALWKD